MDKLCGFRRNIAVHGVEEDPRRRASHPRFLTSAAIFIILKKTKQPAIITRNETIKHFVDESGCACVRACGWVCVRACVRMKRTKTERELNE